MTIQLQPWLAQQRSDADVGLVVLENDGVSGPTLQRLLGHPVCIQVARMQLPQVAADADQFEECLRRAAVSIIPYSPPTIIAMACTTGAMRLGRQRIQAALSRSGAQVATADPLGSAFAALRHLGLKRLAILSPYVRNVSVQIAGAFHESGFSVGDIRYFDAKDSQITAIADESIVAATQELARSGIDAIFLSCTGMQAVPLIAEIERNVQIPVLTSLSVLAWQIAVHLGIELKGPGHLLGKRLAVL